MVRVRVSQVRFLHLDRRQTVHAAATWSLLLFSITHINCIPATRLLSTDLGHVWVNGVLLCNQKRVLLGLENVVRFLFNMALGPPDTYMNCSATPACGRGDWHRFFLLKSYKAHVDPH